MLLQQISACCWFRYQIATPTLNLLARPTPKAECMFDLLWPAKQPIKLTIPNVTSLWLHNPFPLSFYLFLSLSLFLCAVSFSLSVSSALACCTKLGHKTQFQQAQTREPRRSYVLANKHNQRHPKLLAQQTGNSPGQTELAPHPKRARLGPLRSTDQTQSGLTGTQIGATLLLFCSLCCCCCCC